MITARYQIDYVDMCLQKLQPDNSVFRRPRALPFNLTGLDRSPTATFLVNMYTNRRQLIGMPISKF